jgi:hypothetical protein
MSAFGSKADIGFLGPNVCFFPKEWPDGPGRRLSRLRCPCVMRRGISRLRCALSARTNKLHSAEAAAAKPSVTERYQCQTETQSRGGR